VGSMIMEGLILLAPFLSYLFKQAPISSFKAWQVYRVLLWGPMKELLFRQHGIGKFVGVIGGNGKIL